MIEIILFFILFSISILLIKCRFENRPDWTNKSQTSASGARPAPETWWSRQWKKIPKVSAKGIILILLLLIVLSWNFFHTNTYTFNTKENISDNWQINSGSENVKVENNCMVISGPAKITIKGSENMDVSNIVIVPCDDSMELDDVHIILGNLDTWYFKGVKYREGTIMEVDTRETVHTFFPTVGNLISNNNKALLPLVLERGAIAWPNYKLWAGNWYFDRITFAQSRASTEKGKGAISIEIKNRKVIKIKKITVTEGLLVRIIELEAGGI